MDIPEKTTLTGEEMNELFGALTEFRRQGLRGDMRVFRRVAARLSPLTVAEGLYKQPPSYINDKQMFIDLKKLGNILHAVSHGMRDGTRVVHKPISEEFTGTIFGMTSDGLLKVRLDRTEHPIVCVTPHFLRVV